MRRVWGVVESAAGRVQAPAAAAFGALHEVSDDARAASPAR